MVEGAEGDNLSHNWRLAVCDAVDTGWMHAGPIAPDATSCVDAGPQAPGPQHPHLERP
jgi:hypothetical protein